MSKPPSEQFSEEETARRRDEALKRALSMPPKPHNGAGKSEKKKAAPKRGRHSKSDS
jgi:hypothetical protein